MKKRITFIVIACALFSTGVLPAKTVVSDDTVSVSKFARTSDAFSDGKVMYMK